MAGNWIGCTVKLRANVADGDKGKATIIAEYPDIPGGFRLDRELNGFASWHQSDLIFLDGPQL